MKADIKKTDAKAATGKLIIGGVTVESGRYLLNAAQHLSPAKPDKHTGYAFFDGSTLTLHNYVYSGAASAGIFVSGLDLTLKLEGESSLTVDAVEKGAGLCVESGAVKIRGKGALSISVQNGRRGNYGVFGGGTVELAGGTLRISVGLPQYEVVDRKKVYSGESYAIYIKDFIDKGARVTGNDKRGNKVNLNNIAQVVYDFPRVIPWLPLGLGAVALIAVGITVWALFFRAPEVLAPDYAPVDVEQHAELMQGETDTEKMEQPEGGGAINVIYRTDVSIDRSGGGISLYFANPTRSNKDVVLQLVIKDEVFAQSGTLHPGSQVRTLELLEGMADKLEAGGYNGIMRVLAYEPETGEKAILNTDIAVNITVS